MNTGADDRNTRLAATAPQDSIRTRTVVIYLVLASLVLIPGLVLRLGYESLLPGIEPIVSRLKADLLDIRFGEGLRFWLGVAGASMMGLLLFYPLRKWLGPRNAIGRVAGWFHWHLVLGIAGPVAIAYHTNFGHGGTHANLALWAMILVALSGIVGQFVYTRASAEFYRGKLRAREQVGAIIALLNSLDVMQPSRKNIIADFEALEKELLTPRQGVIASISARLRLESRRRTLSRALGWHIGECVQQLRLDEATHAEMRQTMAVHLQAFVSLARHGASRSVSEQLLARWRLLHLPVFLIMVVATALHVRNVWDMDAPPAPTEAVRPVRPQVVTAPIPAPKRVTTSPVVTPKAVDAPVSAPADRRVATAGDTLGGEATKSAAAPPSLQAPVQVPRPVQRPQPPPVVAQAPPPAEPPRVAPTPRPTPQPKPPIEDLGEQAQRMGLGGGKPRTLAEQIPLYKARMKAGQFAHSQAETGFGLTGKHVKIDCASCHTAPLRDGRPDKVRACIDCHRADDVHRGRRPNCAQCHTPNSWGEIIKRR